jgi:hypothetical protein
MRAYGLHTARRTKLLVVVLGIASALAACGNNQASPAATSATTVTTPAASGAIPPAEVTRLFSYDRRQPLSVTKLGGNTGRLPAQALVGMTVEAITYASPKGGEVPALLVIPKGRGRSRA